IGGTGACMRRLACLAASLLAACGGPSPQAPPPEVAASAAFDVVADWPSYGRDLGGSRYSALKQINIGNVGDLREAWSYPLDADNGRKLPTFGVGGEVEMPVSYHAAPLLFEDRLIVGSTTGPGSVRAYDVRTGAQVWVFAAVAPGTDDAAGAIRVHASFTLD